MKTLISLLAATLLLWSTPSSVDAQEPVTLDYFYDSLEPYGDWREVGDYGYCWQPNDVDDTWRPYSNGRWVYTDAGWTWDSDEPFGWAVYHYGRWLNVEDIGWVWVPGTEWGPGWVSWRHSSQYVGWAPLPPEAVFREDVGFGGWVDDSYDIGPDNYCFVEGRDMGAQRLSLVFIDRSMNRTIIRQTVNITRITYENQRVHNGGPQFDQQLRESLIPIPRYRLDFRREAVRDGRHADAEYSRSRRDGESLSVLAPSFRGRAVESPKKVRERVTGPNVDRGWKSTGGPADVAEMRRQLKRGAKPPGELPQAGSTERRDGKSEAERRADTVDQAERRDGSREGRSEAERRAGTVEKTTGRDRPGDESPRSRNKDEKVSDRSNDQQNRPERDAQRVEPTVKPQQRPQAVPEVPRERKSPQPDAVPQAPQPERKDRRSQSGDGDSGKGRQEAVAPPQRQEAGPAVDTPRGETSKAAESPDKADKKKDKRDKSAK